VIELALEGASVVFSTRTGGVSEGPYASLNLGILTDDEPVRVARNRELLAGAAGLDTTRIAMSRQVHSDRVIEWNGPPGAGGYERSPGEPAALEEADGHVTSLAGLGLLVLVADCLPVALVAGGRIAMLHCGWRGLAAGIVERGVAELADGARAAVGPGIGPCCYEVGDEVGERFADVEGAYSGGTLDLRRVVDARLRDAGVSEVEHVYICTSCREDLFFSHRRDGGVTGRQAGLIWMAA
jgi:YfiH family protein